MQDKTTKLMDEHYIKSMEELLLAYDKELQRVEKYANRHEKRIEELELQNKKLSQALLETRWELNAAKTLPDKCKGQ